VRFFAAARRVPGRGAIRVAWFDLWETMFEIVARVVWGCRVTGREHVPRSGPTLFVSNHQSFLDPVANGIAVRERQFTAIARRSLFRFPLAGWLLRSWSAQPIDEKRGDAEALRIAVSELAAGRCILIYPEGTRSLDGGLLPFRRGFLLLQRRAAVDVLPIAVTGTIDVWPKGRSLPRMRGRIQVAVGPVIPASELAALSPDAAVARVRDEIARLLDEANAALAARTGGRWPRTRGAAAAESAA